MNFIANATRCSLGADGILLTIIICFTLYISSDNEVCLCSEWNNFSRWHNIKSINSSSHRRYDHAEFFHHIERFPEYLTSRFQSDGYERVGWCVHVLHLRIAAGVCLCQLCGKEASATQRRLPTRRESSHSGWLQAFPTEFSSLNILYVI